MSTTKWRKTDYEAAEEVGYGGMPKAKVAEINAQETQKQQTIPQQQTTPTIVPKVQAADSALGNLAAAKSFSYNGTKPTYASPYSEKINQLFDEIMATPDFKYNPESDESYLALQRQYTNLGKNAMKDTTAQIAAQTGGIASSYAASAGAQAYNNYMNELSGFIPELQQLSYQMYLDDLNKKYKELDMYNGLEEKEYGRYMDELNEYYTDYDIAYNQFLNEQNQQNYLNELEYQKSLDELAQQNYLNELEFNREQFDYNKKQDALAQQNYLNELNYNKDQADYERLWSEAITKAEFGDYSGLEALGIDTTTIQESINSQKEQEEYDRIWIEAITKAEFGDYSGIESLGIDTSALYSNETEEEEDFDPYSKETIGVLASDILYDRSYNAGGLPTAGLLPKTTNRVPESVIASVLGVPESDLVRGVQRTQEEAVQKADEKLRSGAIDSYQYELIMKQLDMIYDSKENRLY